MTKILIDEAVVRRFIYATAMVVDCAQLEDWQLELHDKAGADLAEALADAALDKMADNARELGIQMQPTVPWSQELEAVWAESDDQPAPAPAPAQEPDPDELTIAYMSGVYEGKKRKPWVGLTDEEKDAFWRADEMTGEEWDKLFAEVEAKLREKNA